MLGQKCSNFKKCNYPFVNWCMGAIFRKRAILFHDAMERPGGGGGGSYPWCNGIRGKGIPIPWCNVAGPRFLWTDWQTLVKTLPSRKLSMREVQIKRTSHVENVLEENFELFNSKTTFSTFAEISLPPIFLTYIYSFILIKKTSLFRFRGRHTIKIFAKPILASF